MPIGIVAFYNKKKGFGFIRKDGAQSDEKDLFFHISGCRRLDTSKGFPEFVEDGSEQIPTIGDRVAFIEKPGDKGPTAALWALSLPVQAAVPEERYEPNGTALYRVRSQKTYRGQPPGEIKNIWKGRLNSFLRKFRWIGNDDPLAPSVNGKFTKEFWLEADDGSGWRKCPDPRLGAIF